MCGDKSDDKGANPKQLTGQSMSIGADDQTERQTAILRIRSKSDLDLLHADIIANGVTIISAGAGVIVIEASGQIIDELRNHEYVVSVEEPKKLQMRKPTITHGNGGVD